MTDKYLCALWSKAVRAEKGMQCYNSACDQPAHSVHHVIKRRFMLLRYDVVNGVPLCKRCHDIADSDRAFAFGMLSEGDREYLCIVKPYDYKAYLLNNSQTEAEFMQSEAKTLREIIRRCR